MAPPRVTDFPVVKGTIRQAKGVLGAFEVTVDDYAAPAPSSRGALEFSAAAQRRGVALRHPHRSVRRHAAVSRRRSARGLSARRSGRSGGGACAPCSRRAISPAPSTSRATSPSPPISARIRARRSSAAAAASISARPAPSRRTAITLRSMRGICAGCGQCAAACPTGAAAYALPPSDALLRKLRTLAHRLPRGRRHEPGAAVPRRRARHAR